MEKAIIGKKVGMTQIFDADGKVIPVTVIEAGPCTVVQKKTLENDGYEAVQMGFQPVAECKLTKPELGHLAKAGAEPLKVLKEFRLDDCSTVNVGDVIRADVFAEGVKANVIKSARNIPGVLTTPATQLSVYDIINAKALVIDKAALATIEEVFA